MLPYIMVNKASYYFEIACVIKDVTRLPTPVYILCFNSVSFRLTRRHPSANWLILLSYFVTTYNFSFSAWAVFLTSSYPTYLRYRPGKKR